MHFRPIAPAQASLKNLTQNLAQAHQLRRQLRRPSGFRFVIADGIDMLDPVQWDSLVAQQSFFLQRQYLQMLEEAGPENIVPRYVMIYDGAQAVAAMALQIASVTGTRLAKVSESGSRKEHESAGAGGQVGKIRRAKNPLALLKFAFGPAARSLQAGLRERILVCGNLLSYGFHGIAFAKELAPEARAGVWPAIAEALYRVRRAEKLSGQTDFILIKDITPEQMDASSVLRQLSYRALETEPNMLLQLQPEWKSHDDYLASMQSKYRSAVKQQVLKPIEAAGMQVRCLAGFEEISQYAERLHQLYLQVHEKAAMRLFTLPPVYFPALAEVAGENLLCSVIEKDGVLLGFIITLKDGDTAYGYHIGFDKAAAGQVNLPIYLRLLHASIADACTLGCSQLSLGRTALEPKAGLGAKAQAISVWVRHRQPVMNVFVRNLLGMVHHDEAPERNPFKK